MPAGGEIRIIPGELAKAVDSKALPVRLVDDPTDPPVRALDPDKTHPFRQTELLTEVNKRLKVAQEIAADRATPLPQPEQAVRPLRDRDVRAHRARFLRRPTQVDQKDAASRSSPST